MVKNVTKVAYKPDVNSTSEYVVIINPEEYKKWKAGDTTIAVSQVVDSYTIYHSGQGHQGLLGQASKQQLDGDFGTHKDDEVVKIILEKGKSLASDGISSSGIAIANISRGGKGSVEVRRS